MNRKKRLLPLLMALLLIVSYLPVMRSYAAECIVRGDNHTQWNSVQDGVFTYDGGTMTITTSYGSLTGTADNVTVPENTTVTVTLSPKEGYTVQLCLNGAQVTLNNNVYKVVTSANQPELKFEACFINPGGGNNPGNPNPPAGNQPICLILEGNAFDGADTDYYHYMKSQDKSFEIYVDLDDTGNSRSQTMDNLMKEQKVSLTPESRSTYRFADSVSNARVTVMCSSQTYTITTPGTTSNGSSGERSFAVKKGESESHIQIDKNSKTLTVTWAYDSDSFGADAYLEHGKAQITAIEGVSDFSTLFGANPGDAKGGNIAVPAGKKVTIKLVPDYGYQVAGLQLNGGVTLQPDDAQTSTFTFVMGNSPVHMKGIFTKVSDTVNSNSKQIEAASITNGANAAASGNLRLTVSDAESYDTTSAQALVSGAQSAQAVDLKLDQIVSKGNGSNWENNITEFEKPVTLNLALDNYDANYDYTVVRNHNGKLTELSTTVERGTISFETNQFSTYIIVKKSKAASVDKPSTTPSTTTPSTTPAAPDTDVTKPAAKDTTPAKTNNTASPKTGDAMPVAGMMLVMAGSLTGYVVIRRKRR